jgi:hypothetical protein
LRVQTEALATGKLTASTIGDYDCFGKELTNLDASTRAIYNYFWDFIVDDKPFSRLNDLSDDFTKAAEVLSISAGEGGSQD